MISIAIVGCGYWGPNLIRNFNALPDCKVKTVCDTSEERLAHMKKLYPGVQTTQDFNAVMQDAEIQAVAIATPVRFHHAMAKQALAAGKHTFIEKPMAASVAECAELNQLAKDNNLTLMVGHTFVYSAPVRKIKDIINTGDLGQLMYMSSRRLNLGLFQKDINVAWDLAPHDISIMQYLIGEAPIAVSCTGKADITPDIEDITNMTVYFANGGYGIIQSSWMDPNKVREMTFVGSKRMLVFDDLQPQEKIKIYDKRVERPPHYDTFAEFQYAYHYGDTYSPFIQMVEPLKVEAQHFVDCIQNGTKPLSSGEEGMMVVQVLEASSESLKEGGRRVAVKTN